MIGRRPAGCRGRAPRAEFARAHHRHVPQARSRAARSGAGRRGPRARSSSGRCSAACSSTSSRGGSSSGSTWCPIAVVLVLMRALGRDEPNPTASGSTGSARRSASSGLGGTVFALIEQGALRLGVAGRLRAARRRPRRARRVRPVGATRAAADAAAQPVPRAELRRRATSRRVFIYASFSLGPFVMTIFLQETGGLLGDARRARDAAADDHARPASARGSAASPRASVRASS